MRLRLPALLLSGAAALLLPACASDGGTTAAATGDAPLEVVVGVYPYEFVVERVGGDDVEVRNVTPPGAEPHDLELSPREVGALAEADLVVHSAGFQPALDDALAQQDESRSLDVLTVVEPPEDGAADAGHPDDADEAGHTDEAGAHEDEGPDPHLWLDPSRLAVIAGAVADRLGELDPDRADAFGDRADELAAELADLDRDLRTGLSSCARSEVVVSHAAFGYLTERYGLEQVPITGLSPEVEPSPGRLAEVARLARERGVTTVFFEELVSPRVAEQLAREVGARTAVLSPLEGPPETGDYLTAMRENLDRLRTALGCT